MQRCPICFQEVPENPRYPRYVCQPCAGRVASADGRPLEFFNLDLAGGFTARYGDTREPYPDGCCFIDGIACLAEEARFGGIVIQVRE